MIFLGIGLIQYFSGTESQIEFQKGSEVEAASTSANTGKIVVDVSGEVVNPGVYKLSSDARVQDAITAAGGLSTSADAAYIAKSVNLASVLKDGIKIYIPRVGEAPVQTTVMGATTEGSGDASSGMISVNSASSSELESLPGIGTVTAGKIINGRPYGSIEELLSKKIVGQSVYEKIKDSIGL